MHPIGNGAIDELAKLKLMARGVSDREMLGLFDDGTARQLAVLKMAVAYVEAVIARRPSQPS